MVRVVPACAARFAVPLAMPLASLLAIAIAPVTGCGAARPTFEAGVYRHDGVAFRVPNVPSGWRPVDVTDAALAFRDAAHDASVLVNARCGEKDGDAPLIALTNQLVMGTTERALSAEETIPFDGREARHTKMTAKLDGVPRAFDIYVLKKDGCVYDFVYVSAPEHAEGGAPAFEAFAAGFHTLPAREP